MIFSKPISEIIKQRTSIRTYSDHKIEKEVYKQLSEFAERIDTGPFGNRSRFEVVAATEDDSEVLRNLGTYGFIHNAPGYIIGASIENDYHLEDFGYLMEKFILFATDKGLGTCWLGGTFTRSKFADKIIANNNEIIPAVTAVGYASKNPRSIDQRIRKSAGSDNRLLWSDLFFNADTGNPVRQEEMDDYGVPLEMVRLGPSASNKQPWRIVKDGSCWHFYLLRTPGYLDNPYTSKMQIVDLQRVDMGIAMCHFELTSIEMALNGKWKVTLPNSDPPIDGMEYLVSWMSESGS